MFKFIISFFFTLLLLTESVFAQDFLVTNSQFRFHANENGFYTINAMRWKPTIPYVDYNISVSIHGEPDPAAQCSVTQDCIDSTCFVQDPVHWDGNLLTGLVNPITYAPKCPYTYYMGNSLITTSNASGTPYKGIGLYTFTGPKPNAPGNAFFQPNQTSGAPNIQGNYVQFPVSLNGSMEPFDSPCSGGGCGDKRRMRVWTKQAVVNVDNGAQTQTQQKMSLVLENTADLTGSIEFSPFTFCTGGVGCGTNAVNYAYDPMQGRFYVGGKLLGGGQTSYLGTTPVWQSYGPASQVQTFDTTWFHYEISWKNFKDTLRTLTTLEGLNGSDDAQVASLFGNSWNARSSWVLKNVRFAQEVYNPNWNGGQRASVGGHTSWIQVDAITK